MIMNLDPGEAEVLAEIRRAGGFRSDEDAVLGALFWYARFLDLDVHPDQFALALPPAMRARALAPEPDDTDDTDQGDLFPELP
jgi:hypothetical protein